MGSAVTDWRVTVPEGARGPWRVERFEIDKKGADWHNMLTSFQPGMGRRLVEPGTYTRLLRGNTVVMSDTSAEQHDHTYAFYQATGRVLIHGLGLGMFLGAVLRKPEVTQVTVVEIDADVIALVGPHYQQMADAQGKTLEIIRADALTWKPPKGARWDVAWHDIWDDICSDNLPAMKRLHRRYGRRAGWQGSWARELITYC